VSAFRIALVLALVAAAAAIAYWFWQKPPLPVPPGPARVEAPAPPPATPQGPKYPVAATEAPAALPPLRESDVTILEALSTLAGADAVRNFLYAEEVIRHVVVTIDNLPRKTYAARLSPVRPPGGLLATTGRDEALAIAPANSARYTAYVRALDAVDSARLVALYTRFYPLFQQAYVDLGYPNGYFNDRLVEVIDDLEAAPDVKGPLKLTVPHVLYEYADPQLEALSSGRKLMLRMGPDNAARVKAKLRDIRRRIVERPPGG
jgi:hypothetical protein